MLLEKVVSKDGMSWLGEGLSVELEEWCVSKVRNEIASNICLETNGIKCCGDWVRIWRRERIR